MRPGQGHSRDRLAAPLRGEASDERARDGRRYALADLRRALARAPRAVKVEGQTLALNRGAAEVDVVELRA